MRRGHLAVRRALLSCRGLAALTARRGNTALPVLALSALVSIAAVPARAEVSAATAAPSIQPALTIEQVASGPFVSDLVAARQGGRIAWLANRQGERNVWVADAPAFVPRQVTHYHGDEGQ